MWSEPARGLSSRSHSSASGREFLDWSQDHDVLVLATTPDADELVSDVDLTGRIAILVGSRNSA